ncbi:HAD family hydrolase [bacterium]|nr:HAD family hydrolase [bacterium]
MNKIKNIHIIAFDGDDTLWVNESYYQKTEGSFCELLSDFLSANKVSEELFKTEMQNLALYGYGAKAFTLSLIETAIRISNGKISAIQISEIIKFGKQLIDSPIELLDGVPEVLSELSQSYTLILATKGDLLDQERKLQKSGLESYFHHIEIMSDKQKTNYQKLLHHLDSDPSHFLMVGNSLKSDILPVLNIGGEAVYVPFHTTWLHEQIGAKELQNQHFHQISSLKELPAVLTT